LSTKFNPESEGSLASWDLRLKNRHFEIKINRNTAIAIFISLLVHAVVLFGLPHKKPVEATSVANLLPKTINVRLAELPSKKIPRATAIQKPPVPAVIAVEKNVISAPPQPIIKAPLNPDNNAPKDFMSFIKAKRQHSQDLEDYAARENANARPLSEEELRDANIKRNLQQPGTSGIFEIRQKASRSARFSFKGWKNDNSIPKLELIDVSVGADGNIELAIVKRMIEIIRREYKGDFNWESQRLGRVILLSARMEDNAGLEEFLMQEFFSVRGNY
jgi:hypothetical protein